MRLALLTSADVAVTGGCGATGFGTAGLHAGGGGMTGGAGLSCAGCPGGCAGFGCGGPARGL